MDAGTYAESSAAFASSLPVSRDDVRRWIDSGDLLTWSAVFALIEEHPARVTPDLTPEERADFTRRYLLRCIDENPAPNDLLHGGYEAAWELATCLKAWCALGGRVAATVRGVALDLGNIYRRGEAATRNRVLCGVLEHAFEEPAVRPYFATWNRDEDLRDAYRLATEWGSTHE